MGSYTAHGVYIPDIFEVGWGEAVNGDLELLEEQIAGGGGSGTGLGWVNAAASPYGATGDGTTDDSTALTAAVTAAIAGGALLYVPKGIYKWTRELANLDVGGFGLIGDGPGLTVFLVGDDMGSDTGLFSTLSRHGVPDTDRAGPMLFQGFSVLNPDRTYTCGAFPGFWQSKDVTWRNIYMEGLVGPGIQLVAGLRPTHENVTMVDCGRGDSGFSAIMWEPSLEGGVTAGICEDGEMRGVKVVNSGVIDELDHGVRWMYTSRCRMTGCLIDGSGAARSAFYGQDLDGCIIQGNNIENGSDDCIHLQSSGSSKENVVVGNVCRGAVGGTPGTGFGINEYSANADQTHADNVIENNVGTVNRA